jgi:GNAT superfamily N-acetyltransferase
MKIVRALPQDCEKILELIKDLAEYEKAPHEVKATVKDLEATLFSSQPSAFCDLVKVDGETVGFAIWFLNYSTWQGKYGIYLEDLFIKPEFRGVGYGKALLKHLAKLCIENGYGRLQWWVLDWNKPAIDFYLSLGAKAMDEWTVFRLSGDALQNLAEN